MADLSCLKKKKNLPLNISLQVAISAWITLQVVLAYS
jgi:hypothetical protein